MAVNRKKKNNEEVVIEEQTTAPVNAVNNEEQTTGAVVTEEPTAQTVASTESPVDDSRSPLTKQVDAIKPEHIDAKLIQPAPQPAPFAMKNEDQVFRLISDGQLTYDRLNELQGGALDKEKFLKFKSEEEIMKPYIDAYNTKSTAKETDYEHMKGGYFSDRDANGDLPKGTARYYVEGDGRMVGISEKDMAYAREAIAEHKDADLVGWVGELSGVDTNAIDSIPELMMTIRNRDAELQATIDKGNTENATPEEVAAAEAAAKEQGKNMLAAKLLYKVMQQTGTTIDESGDIVRPKAVDGSELMSKMLADTNVDTDKLDMQSQLRGNDRRKMFTGLADLFAGVGDIIKGSQGARVDKRDLSPMYHSLDERGQQIYNTYLARTEQLRKENEAKKAAAAQRAFELQKLAAQQGFKAGEAEKDRNLKFNIAAMNAEAGLGKAKIGADATKYAADQSAAARKYAADKAAWAKVNSNKKPDKYGELGLVLPYNNEDGSVDFKTVRFPEKMDKTAIASIHDIFADIAQNNPTLAKELGIDFQAIGLMFDVENVSAKQMADLNGYLRRCFASDNANFKPYKDQIMGIIAANGGVEYKPDGTTTKEGDGNEGKEGEEGKEGSYNAVVEEDEEEDKGNEEILL